MVRGEPALEQHRLREVPDLAQQRVVLHVARADLEDVGVARQQRDLRGVHHLAHHREPVGVGGAAQDLEPLLAQALERVGRGARLERAAAQDRCAPAFATAAAMVNACSSPSTEHGPAIRASCALPMAHRPTEMMVSCGRNARETSLKGALIFSADSTPGPAPHLGPVDPRQIADRREAHPPVVIGAVDREPGHAQVRGHLAGDGLTRTRLEDDEHRMAPTSRVRARRAGRARHPRA